MIGGADFPSRGSERSSIVVFEPSHLSLPLFYLSLRALFYPSLRALFIVIASEAWQSRWRCGIASSLPLLAMTVSSQRLADS